MNDCTAFFVEIFATTRSISANPPAFFKLTEKNCHFYGGPEGTSSIANLVVNFGDQVCDLSHSREFLATKFAITHISS